MNAKEAIKVYRTLQDIQDFRERAEELEQMVLTEHGWKYTCDESPFAVWLWKKTVEGNTLITSAEIALRYVEAEARAAASPEAPKP